LEAMEELARTHWKQPSQQTHKLLAGALSCTSGYLGWAGWL